MTPNASTCPWCHHPLDPAAPACPSCGAPTDIRASTSDSGWTELPPIKDMARLQFGQSFCQIEGSYVPVADFNLAPHDGIYFAHHLLLWKDEQVNIALMPLAKAFNRLFAGLPLVMTQASGPGRIAFSKDAPGELIALPLSPGQAVDVREHVFMIATHSIAYDWFQTGIWFQTTNGKDTETHYPIGMFLDRFTAAAPGLLLLHGSGNVFTRTLEPHQSILIKPSSLLFKDPTVRMTLHIEKPGGTWQTWRTWSHRYLWLRLTGPGRLAIQSHYPPVEDPGSQLSGLASLTTTHQW